MLDGCIIKLNENQLTNLPNWLSQPDQVSRAAILKTGDYFVIAPMIKRNNFAIQKTSFIRFTNAIIFNAEEVNISKSTKLKLDENQNKKLPNWLLYLEYFKRVDILKIGNNLIIAAPNANLANWYKAQNAKIIFE